MVKHIVMWKLKDSANGKSKQENALEIKRQLESLNGRMPGMVKLEVGLDFSNSENSCDIVLYSEFESQEALDNYQLHPDHEKLKPFVSSCRYERRVVDFEI